MIRLQKAILISVMKSQTGEYKKEKRPGFF